MDFARRLTRASQPVGLGAILALGAAPTNKKLRITIREQPIINNKSTQETAYEYGR